MDLLWWLMVLISRIPTCAWLYVTSTMSNSSSLCGYRSRKRAFTASSACQSTVSVSNWTRSLSHLSVQVLALLALSGQISRSINLDERESWSGGEGFVFMLDLVPQVLLHSLLLKHLLLPLRPKQDPGGNGDGDGVLWLRLREETRGRFSGRFELGRILTVTLVLGTFKGPCLRVCAGEDGMPVVTSLAGLPCPG